MGFDEVYQRVKPSAAHAELVGEGLPDTVEPFSFVPLAGMRFVLAELAIEPGQTMADFGCGRGGPGLWLAAEAQAELIGIDSSAVAIADAQERVKLFPTVRSARFKLADVTSTGLPSGSVDAAISIDVLQLVPGQAAMLKEMARVLKPAGRAVLTTWEGFGTAADRFPADTRTMLEQAGFTDISVAEQEPWLTRQNKIYDRALTTDDGTDPAITDLANEARKLAPYRDELRRVVVTGLTTRG
jgi:SAM-dependent methyltransferase